MFRIDNATNTASLPTPAVVGPNPDGFFIDGNPGLGIAATVVDADWANAVQEEICNVITSAGLTLDKTAQDQLYDAVIALINATPVADTNAIVKGSADASKLLRFEVDGLTTATTRVWTIQDTDVSNAVVQRVSTQTGAVATGTTTIPNDDTIPQNTEGDQYMTLSITPKSATNILVIEHIGVYSTSATGNADLTVALFQDSAANALAAVIDISNIATGQNVRVLKHIMSAGTTSSTNFKIRAGAFTSGTTTFNGNAGARKLGGVMASSLTITEYAA